MTRRLEWNLIKIVMLRESGASSTPSFIDSIRDVSGYWIARLNRAMTTRRVLASRTHAKLENRSSRNAATALTFGSSAMSASMAPIAVANFAP